MAEEKQTPAAPAIDAPVMREYHFPDHNKTVTASSREEAEKKVADLIAAENKK